MRRYQIRVSARKLIWPRSCPCCCENADSELAVIATRTTGKRVIRTSARSWTVPYCSRCVNHIAKFKAASRTRTACLALSAIVFGVAAVSFQSVAWGAFLCISCIAIFILRIRGLNAQAENAMHPNCASKMAAVEYSGWFGTVHELWFSNQLYVSWFAAANHEKVMGTIHEPSSRANVFGKTLAGCGALAVLAILVSITIAVISTRTSQQSDRSSPNLEHATMPPSPTVREEQQVKTPTYEMYFNKRFGFFIVYPKSFTQELVSDNGTDASFVSPDGYAKLRVSGANNESNQTIGAVLAQSISTIHGDIAYQRETSDWFVISWRDTDTGDIGYQKTFVGAGSENSFIFVYPIRQRGIYDTMLRRIAKAFKPGDLGRMW